MCGGGGGGHGGPNHDWGKPESEEKLPDDYEPCGDCGFDHGYEQEEARRAHRNQLRESMDVP